MALLRRNCVPCRTCARTTRAAMQPSVLEGLLFGLVSLVCLSPLMATAQPPDTPVREQIGHHGMVVAVCPLAADEGLQVLKQGGNAVDAAVATAFMLAVTWPEAGNIGGGGFMLVHPGKDKPPVLVDYREKAPALATEMMFAGDARPSQYKLVGVPGTVAGLVLAHERFGSLAWRDLVMPAARIAEEGFDVNQALADSLNDGLRRSEDFPEFRRVYGKNGGCDPWRAGDRLILPELAGTLRRIAEQGSDGFYQGITAELIAAEIKRGDGLVATDDLRKYQAKLREPIHGTFRGYHVYGPPPPSSGGIALVQMLNILEQFELDRQERYSAPTLHLMVETMRRVYYDRARYLGDSDFVEIPNHLTSKEYAKAVAAGIDRAHATGSRALAKEIAIASESPNTTHFSVVDGNGIAVSNTYTLEQSFGSRIVVRGGGFLLNNEMGDFNPQPGVTNEAGQIGTPPNLVAPGKRMLSSMTPVIVTTPAGKPLLVTGSPGGRTIINTVACVVLNVLEFKMSPAEAVAAPRLHHAWFPDRIQVEPALLKQHANSIEELERLGHAIRPIGVKQGDAHTIWIDPQNGALHGVADSRIGGAARGF
jgi:gamma-glutamyltranspeptidase/glutathione hydrolase